MKVLIVGLGGIGQRHVRNLRTLLGERADILAYRVRRLSHVVTPTLQADSSRDVEKEYGVQAFDSLDHALAGRPDVAFICNPTSLHVPAALACARSGCDLFLEKPISNDMSGIPDLVAAVETGKRIAMVGYQLRFHPCLRRLREILTAGSLGRVLAVRATVGEYMPGWHAYEDYRQMYASRADLGGGVIVSQIHEFDYLYSLFGLPRRLFALGGHWSSLEIDVEDVASTLMECHTAAGPLAVHLHQDYLQRPPSRHCEVIGDQGKVLADFANLSVTVYDRNGNVADAQSFQGLERNQLFMDELKHFLSSVDRRQKPVVDLRDGLASLSMALAARKSIASGRVVELDSNECSEYCEYV